MIIAPTNHLVIAGRVFTDLTNLIIVYGFLSSNTRCTLRRAAAASGYTPSGLNKFRMQAFWLDRQVGVTNSGRTLQPGYSDNDVGWDSAAVFSTAKYLGGSGGWGPGQGQTIATNDFSQVREAAIDLQVPNGKFAFIELVGTAASGTSAFIGYGYEEA
jgi:hypothetical protein